mgnify:CR=1 FL=1
MYYEEARVLLLSAELDAVQPPDDAERAPPIDELDRRASLCMLAWVAFAYLLGAFIY